MMNAATAATLLSSVATPGSSGLSAVSARPGSMNEAQADKASKDFESMFVGQMLEQMFGDSIGDEAFGDSETSDVYKGMMMDEYGKQIERSGGIGIAGYVKRELLKLQEV
jgi:flagellar protein FlgJ